MDTQQTNDDHCTQPKSSRPLNPDPYAIKTNCQSKSTPPKLTEPRTMNQQALDAAAKAGHSQSWKNEPPPWESIAHEGREAWLRIAHAALTAYAEAGGERVVYKGRPPHLIAINAGDEFVVWLEPNKELVVRKTGTDGK